MARQIDTSDPQYAAAAQAILNRHYRNSPEANITSAVRNFLILTGLAEESEIEEEVSPGGSLRAVDLTALDTFVEVKRRVGTTGGFEPNPSYVQQLDDYLAEGQEAGVRMGILTDGRRWLLRWPGAGAVRTAYPYGFTLESKDGWLGLYEWLRDKAIVSNTDVSVERSNVKDYFGEASPHYHKDIAYLRDLYREHSARETIQVKRRLWMDLLRASLGEVAHTHADMDYLFVRHTYLSTVVGMVVQASFGLDVGGMADSDPEDLLAGRRFRSDTGLRGIVESDFFAWPAEVGGLSLIKTLARRVARFNWRNAPADIAAILYETVIPKEERRQLGEYYTPDWLAREMVREVVSDPLEQRVLDPACGSGTFIVEAVSHFIDAAKRAGVPEQEIFGRLRDSVVGIDVHPVAVHLARAAWALAARSAIQASERTDVSAPVYLGDALQLRFRADDMFAEHEVTIQVDEAQGQPGSSGTELVFPVRLVEQADMFDDLMSDLAAAIERGGDPALALSDHGITDPDERQRLERTIATMQALHAEGRNHIWAYYTRNLVRPVAISRSKVDVIIGNPPWINYNQTANTLRTELKRQSKNLYGIWTGGRYATHQDVAGLFFARSVDLYLREGGAIGMVMPHSALQAGQYREWRKGQWSHKRNPRTLSVDFGFKAAWDLERLEPNTFFPVAASVVFARYEGLVGRATPLAGRVELWQGESGGDDVKRVSAAITDTSAIGESPYRVHSKQGASVVPRRLYFVNETESAAVIRPAGTITVNPRRGSHDKEPWRSLNLDAITEQTIEARHVFDVHLGETVAPYATLEPLKAALPLNQGDAEIPTDANGTGGISLGTLASRMRDRWEFVSRLWEENKKRVNNRNMLQRLDYHRTLSAQLAWQQKHEDRPVRVVHTASGEPTAALVRDDDILIDYTLFWVVCKNMREAHYLLAIINSEILAKDVNKYTIPNWVGKTRHLQKHLWKLPIPEFNGDDGLHAEVSAAGAEAVKGAARELARARQAHGRRLTTTVARRQLRKWLRESEEGARVEEVVRRLLR